jgi:hypothetical protein
LLYCGNKHPPNLRNNRRFSLVLCLIQAIIVHCSILNPFSHQEGDKEGKVTSGNTWNNIYQFQFTRLCYFSALYEPNKGTTRIFTNSPYDYRRRNLCDHTVHTHFKHEDYWVSSIQDWLTPLIPKWKEDNLLSICWRKPSLAPLLSSSNAAIGRKKTHRYILSGWMTVNLDLSLLIFWVTY